MVHATQDMDLIKPFEVLDLTKHLMRSWFFKLLDQKTCVWPVYGLVDAIKMDFERLQEDLCLARVWSSRCQSRVGL